MTLFEAQAYADAMEVDVIIDGDDKVAALYDRPFKIGDAHIISFNLLTKGS